MSYKVDYVTFLMLAQQSIWFRVSLLGKLGIITASNFEVISAN